MSSPGARSTTLRATTHAFCHALISPPAPAALLRTFFTSSPQIHEHGPPWARARLLFLAQTFSGRDECEAYFTLLAETLTMRLDASAFPGAQGFMVDAQAGMVSVVGGGRFESKKTGKGWDERFIYRFSGFDDEGRIGKWEVWADPLSAWEAVGGQ